MVDINNIIFLSNNINVTMSTNNWFNHCLKEKNHFFYVILGNSKWEESQYRAK